MLRLFVRRGFFDEDQAEGMLQWPHSGFHVHAGVGVSEDDRPFALRLARYCARNPMATDGPTAGTAALDPPRFLARLLTHIPDPGQVMTRYYGWYASRTRGTRARLCPCAPVPLCPCASNASSSQLPASGSLRLAAPAHRPAASLTRQRPARIFESVRSKYP